MAAHPYAKDLKFVVLRNTSKIDFITSDNPAIMANKLALEPGEKESFGIISSGTILSMPLTPRLSALFFDIGIYTVSIPQGTRFVTIKSEPDVMAMNHLQHLHAHKNLYFFNWDDRDRIAEQASAVKNERAQATAKFTTLIRDHSLPGESYRAGSEQEQTEAREVLLKGSYVPPRPSQWPSFLKYRPKPISYNNQTAIGRVRKQEWLRHRRG